MECIEVRQTCKKNGLKRSQERLETDFCTFLVGFQRKVGRVVGRERNGGKFQPQTAAEHTLSTLGMHLLDIIFAPTRATVGPRARARVRVRGKGKGQGQGQGQSTVRGQGER